MLAGGRARQAKPLGRRGEAAGFDTAAKTLAFSKRSIRRLIVNLTLTIYFDGADYQFNARGIA